MVKKDMEWALIECGTYNRIGGLDEQTMRDIAHDNGLEYEELRDAYGAKNE